MKDRGFFNGGQRQKGLDHLGPGTTDFKHKQKHKHLGGKGLSLSAFANAKSKSAYNPAELKKQREYYRNAKNVKKYRKLLKHLGEGDQTNQLQIDTSVLELNGETEFEQKQKTIEQHSNLSNVNNTSQALPTVKKQVEKANNGYYQKNKGRNGYNQKEKGNNGYNQTLARFGLHRSLSPTHHFYSSASALPPSSTSHSSSSAFKPLSPKSYRSSSINFDLARSVSPNRNLQALSPVRSVPSIASQRKPVPSVPVRKMCLCSPSNHPGAFRCSLHRNCPSSSSSSSRAPTNSQLHMRRSAMKNSVVRIGSVEGGEWVKKALSALIRPSSHQVRRRTSFQPQPSRLRHMTRAQDMAVS